MTSTKNIKAPEIVAGDRLIVGFYGPASAERVESVTRDWASVTVRLADGTVRYYRAVDVLEIVA